MASLAELSGVMEKFDPYGEFRKGQMTAQKYDIQQSVLDEQTKEIEAEKQAASLAQQTGQPGQPTQLAQMSKEMIPGAKLYNDDGTLTTAGQINDSMVNAAKLARQSKMMVREASLIDDPYQRAQAMAEARRFGHEAQSDLTKARDLNSKVRNDAIYAAATGESQSAWDAAIKAYQDSGLPLPQGLPTTYTPENAKKLLALLPADLQSKANTDLIKRSNDRRLLRIEERKVLADEAKNRENLGGNGKTYETLDEKVNDKTYGVAKGKVPSKEQTVARRITTDSREVTQGIDQIMTLTDGGMKDTTGTTFANVKDTGVLTAPLKFFTNKISEEDALVYDAMMYPLVKGLTLYQNPDYRPTDNDVKIALQSYKAKSGEPQSVQLNKLAELKKNYLSAAESFLDSNILNAQQANSLKQQIKYVQKAIPWDVKDSVEFTRQKQYTNFEDFLNSRGVNVTVGREKSAESAGAESKPSQEGAKPTEKPASKPMPDATKLKAYADTHFGGDAKKARDYLISQGYKE